MCATLLRWTERVKILREQQLETYKVQKRGSDQVVAEHTLYDHLFAELMLMLWQHSSGRLSASLVPFRALSNKQPNSGRDTKHPEIDCEMRM